MISWVVIRLLGLVLVSVLGGNRRGLILGVLGLAGWLLSLLAGLRFYQPVAAWLVVYLHSLPQVWARPIAFILIATLVRVAVHLLARVLLKRLPKDIHERRINRLLGIIPGLGNGLIAAAIISALLLAIPLNEGLRERVRASQTVNLGRLHRTYRSCASSSLRRGNRGNAQSAYGPA